MYPILFEIGGFPIHAYGALGALGFLVGCAIVLWRFHTLGRDVNRVTDVIFWGALAALLGSRLVFVLQNPGSVHSIGEFFNLRSGGLVFYGAFLTGPPVALALLRRGGLPLLEAWDVFATGLPVAHALSRVGCFAAGCCYGSPWDGPLAVTYPADNPLTPHDGPVHAVQLYEAGALLLIGAATNLWFPRRQWDGQVLATYLILYAVARALLETVRGDLARGFFLEAWLGQTLTFSQGVSAVFVVAATALVVARSRALGPPARPQN